MQEKEAPQEVEESNADFRARIARGPKARMDAKLAPERVAGEAKQEDDLKTQRPGDSVAHHPERVVREGGAMSDGHFQWQPFNPRHQIGNDRPQENGPQKGLLSKSEAECSMGLEVLQALQVWAKAAALAKPLHRRSALPASRS